MRRARVLLADDHRVVAEGLKSLLSAEFDVVGVVEDGRAMLLAATALRPDVIVSDITMPNLNGIEALEELKKHDPNFRVIFLTMHHNVVYARRALQAGACGFVLKHAASDELIMAVRAALEGRTFITPLLAADLLTATGSEPQQTTDQLGSLTLRQREILRHLADGLSAKQIAAKLGISHRTVEFHKYRMMESLGAKTNAEVIQFAIKHGIVET
ncbi:MAG: response regulator [Burkholderiales bacterium]